MTRSIRVAIMLMTFAAVPAIAQSQGQYAGQLQRALEKSAKNQCDAEMMGPALLTACQQQLSGMATMLAQLGPIRSVTLSASQQTPQGLIETYKVQYDSRQLTAVIGGMRDGKFDILYFQ
ncbi:putative Zn-dependent protease [Sphingomonas kyeonggiensis]|uniref:Putative Zn-dependent protease n=1 Tax=Sphingomonas kyeonggiensis TaxID=1268553 RepID=A0A7W7JY36_9SPHN|nr:hypothetical protein [Sphingomonas kyeonggiensis]MBB4836985.1 putative Zn-dependent protease [Sphingomonas kyeonggiensis]